MRYDRTDIKPGDPIYYTAGTERIAGIVISKNTNPKSHADFQAMYRIRITTNKCRTYRKGDEFETSGNFLRKRGKSAQKESTPRPKRKRNDIRTDFDLYYEGIEGEHGPNENTNSDQKS